MSQITVGCDPEFFIRDEMGDTVPVCGLIGGTKDHPKPMEGMKEGFFVQEDGAAVEFNIPPAHTPAEFAENVTSALHNIQSILTKKKLGATVLNSLALKNDWTTKFPNLLQIGCDPDFIAYESGQYGPEPRVSAPDKVGVIRGAGGHVHVGYPTDLCPPQIVAQLLDLMLALPAVPYDKQGQRRQWWGVAGLYRPKSYGIEYRTLSNWWIWRGGSCLEIAGRSIALIESLQAHMIQWQAFYDLVNWKSVRDVIYREDEKAAKTLFNRLMEHKVFADAFHAGNHRALGYKNG